MASGIPFRRFGANVVAKSFILNGVKNLITTTTLSRKTHAGRTCSLDLASGFTMTLPAATGSGDRYRFVVKTAASTNQYRWNVTGNDAFYGGIITGNDTDNSVVMWPAAADADQINWNGGSTGGTKGAILELEDVAADMWAVVGYSDASGTEATPFATGQIT